MKTILRYAAAIIIGGLICYGLVILADIIAPLHQ